MTKEEKIKEAKLKYKKGSLGLFYAIKEVEENNGWQKIESEDDLPKQNGLYDVVCNGIISVLEFFDNGKVKGFIHIGETFINKYNEIGVTHYQRLEQRKQPIY